MADNYKLTIKLPGGAEFHGEGPKSSVKEDYERFLEAIRSVPAPKPRNALDGQDAGSDAGNEGQGDSTGLGPPLMQRLFKTDRAGIVSLRAIPRTKDSDADALLALIYGFQVLRGQHDVATGHLTKGARQTGLKVGRIDRILARQSSFVNAGGLKKGRKYGLNNPGIRRAEEILREVLG